jgi:Glyoxalase-like domain
MTVALDAVNIDCSDAEKLAGFWAAALRRQVRPVATAESATVKANDVASIGPLLMFHQVPEPKTLKTGRTWTSSPRRPSRDPMAAWALGATVVRVFHENGRHLWTTFADPEGNGLT